MALVMSLKVSQVYLLDQSVFSSSLNGGNPVHNYYCQKLHCIYLHHLSNQNIIITLQPCNCFKLSAEYLIMCKINQKHTPLIHIYSVHLGSYAFDYLAIFNHPIRCSDNLHPNLDSGNAPQIFRFVSGRIGPCQPMHHFIWYALMSVLCYAIYFRCIKYMFYPSSEP